MIAFERGWRYIHMLVAFLESSFCVERDYSETRHGEEASACMTDLEKG